MPKINEVLLNKLNENIAKLAENVNQYSHIKVDTPCFDPLLFKDTPSRNSYRYYLSEIEDNYQKLANLIKKNSHGHYLGQIDYLAKLIVNQIEALQRELSTSNLRKQTQSFNKESETVYEKYNKNLEYLRRLEDMKYTLIQTNNSKDANLQQISVVNQRIERCKQAITELELQMELT